MESSAESPAEVGNSSIPCRKNTLWRARTSLWAIAIVTFAWEQFSSPTVIAFGDTASNAQWLRGDPQSAYQHSLTFSVVVALSVAGALVALCIVSLLRKQLALAILDICVIPIVLAWCAVSLATLALAGS